MRSLGEHRGLGAAGAHAESTKENDSSAERVSTEMVTVMELASASSTDSPNLRVRFSEPHRMTVRALNESTLNWSTTGFRTGSRCSGGVPHRSAAPDGRGRSC